MSSPIMEPLTDPRLKPRITLGEVLGAVFALAGLTGLAVELYGERGDVHKLHIWINVGLMVGGMYFVQPRRVREIVGLVTPFIPVRAGQRATDAVVAVPVQQIPVAPPPPPAAPPSNLAGGA